MRKLLLGALVALVGMAFAVPATAADTPPTDDPTYDPIMGAGALSGTSAYPECEVHYEVVITTEHRRSVYACVPSNGYPLGVTAIARDYTGCPVPDDVDLEGYFTDPSQMKQFYACVIPEIEDWARTIHTDVNLPIEYVYIPRGVTGISSNLGLTYADGTPWGCQYNGESTMMYCNLDGRVYLSEGFAWSLYSELGDAAPLSALAHELGHRLQHNIGMPKARTRFESIFKENQADCVSGAFMNYLFSTGRMAPEGDDLTDVVAALVRVGSSAEEHPDTANHGTVDQRTRAFFLGYNDGYIACNAYVTNFSLYRRYHRVSTTTTTNPRQSRPTR